jgi:carboxymethylenebutenolidase
MLQQREDESCSARARDVVEEQVEIPTDDGTVDGFLLRANAGCRWRGLLHLTDIGGIRPAHLEIARRLAARGFAVLMPNVFFRTGRPPLFDFVPRYPASKGDTRTMMRFAELAGPLTPDAMERDSADYVRFLESCDFVRQGPMGVFGYSFTGSMAMRAAAVRSDRIAAAALFHVGGLYNDAAMSPHLLLPRIKARLYFGHAIQDRSMPTEAIENLNHALSNWGGRYESEIYEGAYHSWTVRDSPLYNHDQAERAFEKMARLFAETLT